MFCAKCGAQIEEGAKFCPKCGAPVEIPPAPSVSETPSGAAPAAAPQPAVRTNGFAIASLVLGIIGVLINPLSILAIIFGGVALSQLSKTPEVKGKGLAVAGLVLGIIMVVLWVVAIFWVGWAFWRVFT